MGIRPLKKSLEDNRMRTMHLPIAILEKRRIQRIVFSISSSSRENLYSLMEKVYEIGGWCFHLPSASHLESFRSLKVETGDEFLMGFGHLDVSSGISLTGKPLYQFESKIIATMVRNIIPPEMVKTLFPLRVNGELLTQKEIDRMSFDLSRFHQTLSAFQPQEVPFLLIGGKYGDWLLGLGRSDLLEKMVSAIRARGFIPLFSGQWTTFSLPKAKPLDVAGYAFPINKKKSLFDLEQACKMVKKFDRPLISLDPLAGGDLIESSKEALSFLLDELKVHAVIAEIASQDDLKHLLKGIEGIPSLIPFRKT